MGKDETPSDVLSVFTRNTSGVRGVCLLSGKVTTTNVPWCVLLDSVVNGVLNPRSGGDNGAARAFGENGREGK